MPESHVLYVNTERQRLAPDLVAATLGLSLEAAQSYRHPTPTDPNVIDYILSTYSSPGDMVYDPTCGVGTIAKAALAAGRRGYGSDIVEEYVRLGNADIQQTHGYSDHIRVQSALDLHHADWLHEVGPVDLCFFSPALMNINRPDYPMHADQLGNFRSVQQSTWLDGVQQILAGVKTVLSPSGRVIVNTRNQQAGDQLLPNVHLITARALTIGYKQTAETVVLFPNDAARWPEYLLIFQHQ